MDRENLLKWLPFIITGITALGYLSAYLFEAGSCLFYNIPLTFISISLNQIIKFIVFFSFGSMFMLGQALLPVFLTAAPELMRPMKHLAVSMICVCSIAVSAYFAYYFFYDFLMGTFFILMVPMTITLQLPYLWPWVGKNEKQKIRSENQSFTKTAIIERRLDLFDIELLKTKTIFILLYIILEFSFYAGTSLPKTEPKFYLKGTALVLLKRYDDLMFFKIYLSKPGTFTGPLIIKKMSDSNQLELTTP